MDIIFSENNGREGFMSHSIEMELQAIHRKMFFGKAKKRYASHCIWKAGRKTDSLEIVGMEVRRTDSSAFSRNLQKTVFEMLLIQDKTKDEVLHYVGGQIDRIRKGDYKFTEIGLPKGISKDLSEYQHPATNIRGAIFSMKVLGHDLSNKPKMVYVIKLPENLPKTYQFAPDKKEKKVDSICFDEDNQVPPGTEIDVEKMLTKTVRDKIEPIFEALGWRLSELNPFWRGCAPKDGVQDSLFPLDEYTRKK